MAVQVTPERVLVVNAGSSSLKLRMLDRRNEVLAGEDLPALHEGGDDGALEAFLATAGVLDAVGHRVVHGGPRLRHTVRVDPEVRTALDEAASLAPLHVPPALAALDLVSRHVDAPAVACFDTTFHANIPAAAATYAVPRRWSEDLGIRRYGFHGLSHAWAAERTADLLGRPMIDLRVVTCHLGSGSSLAAVDAGRSVDTTMGFTPLEGMVMGTRSGSIDPGALIWLQRHADLGVDDLEQALERESGLLGISGIAADARKVLVAAEEGHKRARLALEVWAHRVRAAIAAMASAMGGLNALTFTGGIGEGSATLRAAACQRLGFLGVDLDPERNEQASVEDTLLSRPQNPVAVVLVHAREDVVIAREVRRVLSADG